MMRGASLTDETVIEASAACEEYAVVPPPEPGLACDAAPFVSNPDKNPTLTIVALAWIKFAAVPRAPTPSPNLVAAAGPVPDVGYSRNEAGDPLSLLFPDADPVARFAAENGGDDDAGSLFDGQE